MKNYNNYSRREAYKDLRTIIEERRSLQAKYERAWDYARSGYRMKEEINRLGKEIGRNTHEINGVIGRLSRRGGSYADKNMALSYLESEISRKARIRQKWVRNIRGYQCGRTRFIDGNGRDINDGSAREYLRHIDSQISQMREWESRIRSTM